MGLAAAAGIGAVATIGSGVMAANGQKKAANQAAATSAASNASNNALARENRQFGFNVLSPYSNAGLQAQNTLSSMLYGNALQPTTPTGAPMTNALAATEGGYYGPSWDEIQGMEHDGIPGNAAAARAQYRPSEQTSMAPNALAGGKSVTGPMPADPLSLQPSQTVQSQTAQSPWDQFRNSTNYQFRYDEGMKGLNLGLANNGYAGSGMAAKEAIKYGQNFASNELNNYIGLLTGQQQIGMGAASAMVGVGQNTTNALMANNSNTAQNSINAGLVGANANGQMWGSIARGVGQAAGGLGSSYGSLPTQTFTGGGSYTAPGFGS